MDMLESITESARAIRDGHRLGGVEPWYVELPSWMERDADRVKASFQRLHERGLLPPGVVGCRFSSGWADPQLRQITFDWTHGHAPPDAAP